MDDLFFLVIGSHKFDDEKLLKLGYEEREYDSDYYTQPGKLWRLMSEEDQRITCENTARAMGDCKLFIKQRHVRNCFKADPSYGKGVAAALGISLEEALSAKDPVFKESYY